MKKLNSKQSDFQKNLEFWHESTLIPLCDIMNAIEDSIRQSRPLNAIEYLKIKESLDELEELSAMPKLNYKNSLK